MGTMSFGVRTENVAMDKFSNANIVTRTGQNLSSRCIQPYVACSEE